MIAPNTASLVNAFRLAVRAILDNARPNQIAVPTHNRVGAASLMSFIRKQRGVDPTKNDPRTAGARFSPNFVASKRVAGVEPNANDVACLNGRRVNRLKRLIHDQRVSPHPRSSCSKDIQPSRSNDCDTKRHMAWIYEMDTHAPASSNEEKMLGNRTPVSWISTVGRRKTLPRKACIMPQASRGLQG